MLRLDDYGNDDWPAHPPMSALVNGVHHCDALTLLSMLPDKSVDCIITDPPYGVNKASWDAEFPTDWIEEAWRVTDRMLVMTGNLAMIYAANAIGRYRDCIVMNSINGMTRSPIAFGNWFPVLACGDWSWVGRPNLMRFTVKPTGITEHPSQKPPEAMMKLIQWYTKPGDLIVDPFGGSGTTAWAAREHGRNFITNDISREYCDLMERRLAQPFTPSFMPLLEAAS